MKYHTQILCLVCGLTAVLLSLSSPILAQDPSEVILYQESFDDPAEDWELEPGWGIVQDGENWVLAGEGHQWAHPEAGYDGNSRLQFRLKLLQGDIHLVYRLSHTGRYFIGFYEGGSALHKQYFPDTFVHGLAGSDTAHSLGTWHQIEIQGGGARLRFLVNGQVEWEYTDVDPLLSGTFAFETLPDSLAYVDDILVFGPAPTPTPTPDPRFTWVRTGGPLGGLGYDVRMRPDNPDIMYVTDAWAGVFISNDGGETWAPSNQGITARAGESGDAIPIFCLTIDPHDYNIIWAGTQNVRGIFKSTDGGRTWTQMDNGIVEREGITFRGITVDPRSSDTVYAAAEVSSWAWAGEERSGREFDMTQGVVYRTSDGGQNWTAIWRGNNLARYVWIDPEAPNYIYVSTGIFDREAANSIPDSRTPGGVGIVKSTDGGQSWMEINDGLANLYVGTLFMHPENPEVLLAGAGNNQYYHGAGAYLSTNGGQSWQQTLREENIGAVEFAPSNPDIAYAASSEAIYRSQDGGRNWERVAGGPGGWGPPGVRAGFPIDLQMDPRDPNRVFINNYGGGNFLSTDGGRTWAVASQGYTGAQVRDVFVDPAAADRVFAAARSGIFVSHNGGQNWTGLSYPPSASLEWYVVAIDPGDSQHVLAANNWEGVILDSYDGGQVWRPVSRRPGSGLAEGMSWRAIAFSPSDPSIVYAGTSAYFSAGTFDDWMPAAGIYVSHDGGRSWEEANDDTSQDANVAGLAIDSQDPQVVYAATGNHGLLKSTDGGQSWSAINQGLPGSPNALSVVVHPSDPQVVYAGLAFAGLYRSTDGGATWLSSTAGLNPEASISDIVLDPTHPPTMYISDRFSGVYRSSDSGATWRSTNNGLRTRTVNALAISSDGQHLYAATEGEGIFRLDLNGQSPQPMPTSTPVPPTPTLTPKPTLNSTPVSVTPTVAPTLISTPVPPGPTAIAAAPTATSAPTQAPQPTVAAAQKPSRGKGICGGAAAVLPLALIGLLWSRRCKP